MLKFALRTGWRIARVPLSYVATAIIIVILAACAPQPPSTDAGADPAISDCCLWYVVPLLYDRPGTCLCKHTEDGEQRWLMCLDGLVSYSCDKRGL